VWFKTPPLLFNWFWAYFTAVYCLFIVKLFLVTNYFKPQYFTMIMYIYD
jgi:hypothetical protein